MTVPAGLWAWQLLDGAGIPVDEVTPDATTRFDAEAWLGEHWRAIAGRGAARAVLLRAGEPVGPGVELTEFVLLPRE